MLLGGDICPDYIEHPNGFVRPDKGGSRQADWLKDTFKPWLDQVPAEYIVGIAGNHDFVFEHRFLVPELPWVYLQDQGCTVHGVRIYGIPWVPNLPFWAFHARDGALKLAYEQVEECDILLSHGPPYGHLDIAPSKYGSRSGDHVGSVHAVNAIKRMKPDYFICGHIHEGYGFDAIAHSQGDTRIINVAHNDGFYDPINKPVVLDL